MHTSTSAQSWMPNRAKAEKQQQGNLSGYGHIIFIAWNCEHDTRTISLAENLGIELFEVNYYRDVRTFPIVLYKYILATFATCRIILREKPDVVFVQNPPIFGPFVVWILSRIYQYKIITDTHTGMFDRARWKPFLPLFRAIARRDLLNILHNRPLAEQVQKWRAKALTLGDIQFNLSTGPPYPFEHFKNVTVVNSYCSDEPLTEVLRAANQMRDVHFYITGDIRKAPHYLDISPPNVTFTGFLPEENYNSLLAGSDMVMCLTTNNYTMQNGAYEAMELERPIITSDWPVLRKTYHKGAVLVDNSTTEIVKAIREIYANYPTYRSQVRELKNEVISRWNTKVKILQHHIQME